ILKLETLLNLTVFKYLGVHGVTLKGDEIEVTGERVDSVILALLLKKSFRHAELVSVGPVEEKKKENKEEPTMQPLVWPCTSFPQYPICEMRTSQFPDPYCSIMW
ncbi:hypothetical protein D0Y65_035481, partial [Glycine soja]